MNEYKQQTKFNLVCGAALLISALACIVNEFSINELQDRVSVVEQQAGK